MPSKLGKLDELASEIVTARKKLPAWTAGDALLALVLCRAGRYDEAEALVRKLPETIKKDPVAASGPYLFYAYSAIAQGSNKTLLPETWRRRSTRTRSSSPYSFLQFRFERNQTPVGHLVDLYRRDRRFEDARRSLLNLVRDLQFPDGYREELADQRTKCRRSTALPGS